jgi:hypothetical protein
VRARITVFPDKPLAMREMRRVLTSPPDELDSAFGTAPAATTAPSVSTRKIYRQRRCRPLLCFTTSSPSATVAASPSRPEVPTGVSSEMQTPARLNRALDVTGAPLFSLTPADSQVSYSLITDTEARLPIPIALAAAGVRSITRPRTNGPRSLIVTSTLLPLFLLIT